MEKGKSVSYENSVSLDKSGSTENNFNYFRRTLYYNSYSASVSNEIPLRDKRRDSRIFQIVISILKNKVSSYMRDLTSVSASLKRVEIFMWQRIWFGLETM